MNTYKAWAVVDGQMILVYAVADSIFEAYLKLNSIYTLKGMPH